MSMVVDPPFRYLDPIEEWESFLAEMQAAKERGAEDADRWIKLAEEVIQERSEQPSAK